MADNKNTSEIVAYHKVKRRFLNLAEMQHEDPDQLITNQQILNHIWSQEILTDLK